MRTADPAEPLAARRPRRRPPGPARSAYRPPTASAAPLAAAWSRRRLWPVRGVRHHDRRPGRRPADRPDGPPIPAPDPGHGHRRGAGEDRPSRTSTSPRTAAIARSSWSRRSHPPTSSRSPASVLPYYQPSRFYLMRFDPGTGRVSLRALRPRSSRPTRRCTTWPCRRTAPRWPPRSAWITPGSHPAGRVRPGHAGNERAWSFKTCARCHPSSGGLGYGGTNVDALSWTGDGKHVAFVGPNRAGWPSRQYGPAARRDPPGLRPAGQRRPVAEPRPRPATRRGAGRSSPPTADRDRRGTRHRLRSPLKVSVATGRVTVHDLTLAPRG